MATGAKYFLNGLSKLKASAEKLNDQQVTVGIHPENDSRVPTTWDSGIEHGLVGREEVTSNTEIGMRMEFGYESMTPLGGTFDIPPRSWLIVPMLTDFPKEAGQKAAKRAARQAIQDNSFGRFADTIADKAFEYIMANFDSGGGGKWPSNNPLWAEEKGNDIPLHGKSDQLGNAITAKVSKRGNDPF